MEIWIAILMIALVGALGGLVNALLSRCNRLLPGFEPLNDPQGERTFQVGYLGHALLGVVAALITWALTESYDVLGTPAEAQLWLNTLAGAILSGVGWARVFSAEQDKRLLREATSVALTAMPNPQAAADLDRTRPVDALRIVNSLRQGDGQQGHPQDDQALAAPLAPSQP